MDSNFSLSRQIITVPKNSYDKTKPEPAILSIRFVGDEEMFAVVYTKLREIAANNNWKLE